MAHHQKLLHSAALKNNCPECGALGGLHLEFAQEQLKTKLMHQGTDRVVSTMTCSKCEKTIYPERWTDDIDLVYEYNRKLAGDPRTFYKLKPLAIGLILGIVAVAIVVTLFVMNPEILG